jgi:hypothetical protein
MYLLLGLLRQGFECGLGVTDDALLRYGRTSAPDCAGWHLNAANGASSYPEPASGPGATLDRSRTQSRSDAAEVDRAPLG